MLKMTLQCPNLNESNKIYKMMIQKGKVTIPDELQFFLMISTKATSAPSWYKLSCLLFDPYVRVPIKLGEFFHGMLFFLNRF